MPFLRQPSRRPYQDVGGTSRSTDAPVFRTARIPLSLCSEELEEELRKKVWCGQRRPWNKGNDGRWFPRKQVQGTPAIPISWLPGLRSQPEGMRKTGSLEKKCSAPRRSRSIG